MEGRSSLSPMAPMAYVSDQLNAGQGIGTESCGVDDVLPSDDFRFVSDTCSNCVFIYIFHTSGHTFYVNVHSCFKYFHIDVIGFFGGWHALLLHNKLTSLIHHNGVGNCMPLPYLDKDTTQDKRRTFRCFKQEQGLCHVSSQCKP